MSGEHYQQRQQCAKDRVSARATAVTDEHGIITVFTGSDKGKATTAFGIATRAVGHGKKVDIVQFIKGTRPNGEHSLLELHSIEFQVMATGLTWETQNRESDIVACMAVWERSGRVLADDELDTVMLNELTYMVVYDYLPFEEVITILNMRPAHQTVIIIGHGCHRDIPESADTVSELRSVKHAFEAGVRAQIGVDYRHQIG